MAFLSNTTYKRIAKNPERARLLFLNENGEFSWAGTLVKFVKTKGKIHSRWETEESRNIWPFTHVALLVGSNHIISNIKPIERSVEGFVDIDYEGDNE